MGSGVPMMIPKWVLKKLGFTGTTAQVNAAITSGKIKEGDTVIITDDNNDTITATQVSFNNTGTGMSATTAQAAITELNNDLGKSIYNSVISTLVNNTDTTMLADGVLVVTYATDGSQYGGVTVYVNSVAVEAIGQVSSTNPVLTGTFNYPVKKDDVVKVYHNTEYGTTGTAKVYALS